ncbi:glycosyltransferase [Leptolyngbya sp. 'hensonii']|nr:glycosyltransferase [Leptolyngbya sp. 'hensonii']
MKVLLQHRHRNDEISGVLTYVNYIALGLKEQGIDTKVVSTHEQNCYQWLQMILWADIVHMNSNHLLFACLCKIFNRKIVIKYHYLFYQSIHIQYQPMKFLERIRTDVLYSLPKPKYPLKWQLYAIVIWVRLIIRLCTAWLADRHLACSQFLAESLAFPWDVLTLYNPIPITESPIPKNRETLSQPYTFVFVGRLSHDKGVDLLLQATRILSAHYQEFQVLIIGEGQEAKKLKQMAIDLAIEDHVQFLGRLSQAEVLQALTSALALVVPSRWQDPAPYVVLEASSVQTCSIVSCMGGLPEIAGPANFVVNNEDPVAISEKMEFCLQNPQESLVRGRKAQQFVLHHFSPRQIILQLIQYLQSDIPQVDRN